MRVDLSKVRSPKRNVTSKFFREHWYPYYAGFSSDFVESILQNTHGDISKVLDPWNGSGTTTFVSSMYGIRSVGIDINPVMNIVARARHLSSRDTIKAKALYFDTVANASKKSIRPNSLILNWFTPKTSEFLNGLFLSFMQASGLSRAAIISGKIDPAQAAVLLALFCTGGQFSTSLKSKNPTWIKKSNTEKLDLDQSDFLHYFIKYCNSLISTSSFRSDEGHENPILFTSDSQSISFGDTEFDLVLGSPPYATRIDYANKTSLELALLGYTIEEYKILRSQMMGTTSVARSSVDQDLPDITNTVLNMIKCHASKASSSYYYKTYADYFVKLENSLIECSRLLKNNGILILVIQDSYYKDIHVDLSRHISESLSRYGFSNFSRIDFRSNISMRSINTKHRAYNSSSLPVESVLFARR